MASRSHLQIFAPPQDWKTMALNLLMLDNAYSNSALVITPKLNLRQLFIKWCQRCMTTRRTRILLIPHYSYFIRYIRTVTT